MDPARVSIMMPAYDAGGYIAEAIESVLAQSYQEWELLVVNDGSTDDTAEVAGNYRDPRIRIFSKSNGGESSARNMALDHSHGEFIAYLDADDVYLRHHLAVTVGFLDQHREIDAVYTDGLHIDEHGQRLASLQSRRRGPFEGRLYEEVVRASDVFGPPACVVLRHELVARHHMRYDERIVIGPDWDFFTGYAEHATFAYLADQTCLYRVHRQNITAQVDPARRAGFLALCRENAIAMAAFRNCSVQTRSTVFYDLLVNLLRGQPKRRQCVIEGAEFNALPAEERARLLRLMAADAIARDGDHAHIADWLARARALKPNDRRTALLSLLFTVSPSMASAFVKARTSARAARQDSAPFADLMPATPAATH